MKMLKIVLVVVVLLGILVPLVSAADNDIMMASYFWIKIRCGYNGMTIEDRTEVIQSRVNDLLCLGGIDLNSVKVEMQGKDAVIFAGGRVLITVGECDAKANMSTPKKLANVWAKRFKEIYPNAIPKIPDSQCPPKE